MTDQTGGGNPGPIGGHGITVALIGAASAILVGLINGRVWPFDGQPSAPAETRAQGPAGYAPGLPLSDPGTAPGAGLQPATGDSPPSPVQTVRQFLQAVDPEFDAAKAINRKIYVYNRCDQAVSVRIVYEKLDRSIDGLGEQLSIEPGAMILPQSDDGKAATTFRRYALVNARTIDEAIRWTGRYPLTTEQGVMNFRAWQLEVDNDGDYRVTLDCKA